MSGKMFYMGKTTVSIRELQQNLNRVIEQVERGQVIEVTRRGQPVARLTPVRSNAPLSPWPDLEARTRTIFGNRVVEPGASQVVIEARGNKRPARRSKP